MISQEELQMIDNQYFNVIQKSCFIISLQSKNTKHYWNIVEEEFPHFRHFKVYHKHNQSDEFHRHRDRGNLSLVLQDIIDHDIFQMKGRKK